MAGQAPNEAAGALSRQLYFYNAGFALQPRLRDILRAAGWELRLGRPGPADRVVVWGHSPYAARGEAVAARHGVGIVRLEDAFLRSVRPGRAGGGGPLGLLIDTDGVHFDSSHPSMLERILARDPLDDGAILQRGRDGMARLKQSELSKYNDFDVDLPAPAPGYVLVIDQTADDASIRYGGANAATFREMLAVAQIENPGARIYIKRHPETLSGHRPGHYSQANCDARTQLLDAPISPWKLLDGAIAVYTVSSQMGFEAILAGHRPRIFGQPFYSGWGLTQDENPVPRRSRSLTRAQLFAASHILAPTWYDPCRKRLCSFEEALDQLEAEVRAYREDRLGHVASGMRLWKRRHLQDFFGSEQALRFVTDPQKAAAHVEASGRNLLIWASKEPADLSTPALRVEDGFLRSRGLGAALVPPLSLVTDRQGIYYDPTRPSDLEALIASESPPGGRLRTERLIARIRRANLSKYNIGEPVADLPPGSRILVVGQVEDDASIRLGAGTICTNLALLELCRAKNPGKIILFKPHPDVEAGLRPGAVPENAALQFADRILHNCDTGMLLDAVDEVWTMTSLLGFEALLRGIPVTCTGAPFYAGWGLTRDLGEVPARRKARPDLLQLAHAALIAYPRYRDPISGQPCPPEVIVDRLEAGALPRHGLGNRILAKAQGLLASYAYLWRR
ncbi:capsular polysaccharide biosynthesis protein [Sinirhodobacter sp. WL0062]|uniref:Capsular polysaccharide biosynthesis protein n=1 Tax=Rhodobacter flavimaris TaxID=2907145 RepID=A0ABS8YW94_9RHOB|nr:capsular polysaccharide biosynthesis protein [Sinirhodobacter sp. WL0062]MCE5972754.1 capsular polysaccharide biosynthesis protein [Sinirhodobacter sp. WL0062]